MLTVIGNTRQNTDTLITRCSETLEMIEELTKIVFPNATDFRGVSEIANEVFDRYYHVEAA